MKILLIILLSFFAASCPRLVQASDWTPELLPSAQGQFRTPREEFRIFIPPTVPVEVLERLGLTLDSIDVTGMISRDGDYAVFVPPQPLEYRGHVLRIVEYAEDGSILERGVWSFEVRKSALFREAEFGSNLDLTQIYRASDNNLQDLPIRSQAQGGVSLQGRVADGNWKVTGNGDFLYNSQSDQTFNDLEFDVGNFLATGRAGPAALKIGHHSVESESMIMQGFHRRGLSAGLSTKNRLAGLTGFLLRTESITGFEKGLGIEASDSRVFGVVAKSSPFLEDPEKLTISGLYLKGEGEEIGIGEGGDTESSGGNAWSLIADTHILDKRLRLRGEYAKTGFDFDGLGTNFNKEEDYAYSFQAAYTHPEKIFKEKPLNWSLGLEHKRVGTFFHSLANAGFPGDKFLISAFTELIWSALNINTVVGRETDNVEDDPLLPRTQTDQVTMNTIYTPFQEEPSEGGWWSFFHQPSFQTSWSHTRQKQTETPSGFSGTETDTRTKDLLLAATFNPASWDWTISHNISFFEDHSDVTSDTRNNLSSLSINFQVGDRLSISPDVQYYTQDEQNTGVETTSLRTGLSVAFTFYPERLNGSLNYSLSMDDSSHDTIDTTTNTIDAGIFWTIKRPRSNHPGIDLFVNANYQDIDDKVSSGSSTSNYQVFTGIKIGWPANY